MRAFRFIPLFLAFFVSTTGLADTISRPHASDGVLFDHTRWTWGGGDSAAEIRESRETANLLCQHFGYSGSSGQFSFRRDTFNKGRHRLNDDGTERYCDFCTGFFDYINCS